MYFNSIVLFAVKTQKIFNKLFINPAKYALIIGLFLGIVNSNAAVASNNSLTPIPVEIISNKGSSILLLKWGKPVGWQIKSPQNQIHTIIIYENNKLDLSSLDLQKIPEITNIEQSIRNGVLELNLTVIEGAQLNVSWSEGNNIIDVYSPQSPVSLLFNKQRDNRSLQSSNELNEKELEAILTGKDRAYEGATDEVLPLNRNQIIEFSKNVKAVEDAISEGNGPPPEALVRPLPISLESDAKVQTVYLAKNHITTLVFLDATGQAWPINRVALGDAFTLVGYSENSSAQTFEMEGAHEIRLIPKKALPFGNISLSLKDLATPVVLKLVSNRDKADYRVDARLSKYGPNAIKPIIDIPDEIHSVSQTGLAFLSGAPPTNARQITVAGAVTKTKAWEHQGKLWLKTKSTVLSPAYSRRIGSIDGTFVYTMNKSPIVIVSDEGQPRDLRLSQNERGFDYE